MPGYPVGAGLIKDVKDIKKGILKNGTHSQSNPDDVPLAPGNVDLDFKVRELQNKIDYDALASCSGVTPNTCAADIQAYVFQMKAVKSNGDPWPDNKLDSGEEVKWSRVVTRHDASDMETPHAVFERIPHPKEWYYIVRARVIDRIGHLGEWSAWTSPLKPTQAADPTPPTPTGLALAFDKVEKDRYHRYRAIVTCNELNWDIPGGDNEGDIHEYIFELRKSDAAGVPDSQNGRKVTTRESDDNNGFAKAVFFPVRKGNFYVVRVRVKDRYNRYGDWSGWTAAGEVSDVTKPPAPVAVFAEGLFNSVSISWDNPTESTDNQHEDVAFFQVQRSTDRNFSNITNKDLYVAGTRRAWPSRAYKQRFWLRVRSVDASGIKGDWVQAGPVSPQKATAGRQVVAATGNTPTVADIDWSVGGIDLGGQLNNRAYNVSGTNGLNLLATVDGEFPFGTIVAEVTLSPNPNRTKMGVVFHWVDSSNYMYVYVEQTVANGSVVSLRKVDAGVDSSLASSTSFTFQNGQSYVLKIIVMAASVQYQIDDTTFAAVSLSGANQTKYNGATTLGLYLKRGASTDDNGGSRHESISYTADTGEVVVDDDFDRQPSGSSLGIASSGQTWTSRVGTWGIVDESTPTAIYGYGAILPILYMDDPSERNGRNIKSTGGSATTLMGQTGEDSGPLQIDIDRKTRVIMMAWANFMNESTTVDYNLHMFAVLERADGTLVLGRQTKNFAAQGDANAGKRRIISTVHQTYIDPAGGLERISFWWGYRQSDSANVRPATIANQKMVILLSYAPDYDPVTLNHRVPWTKSALMAKAYRGFEQDDS